jgi:hypothetical protein
MNAPPPQTLHVPPHPHWTDPVSREETLARREKFRKVGWRPPNHKPKTKRVIASAKRVWDRYVTCYGSPYLCTVEVRASNRSLSDIASTSVSMPINTYWKAALVTSKTGLIGYTVQPRRSRTKPPTICGDGSVKPTPTWPSSPWTASLSNK